MPSAVLATRSDHTKLPPLGSETLGYQQLLMVQPIPSPTPGPWGTVSSYRDPHVLSPSVHIASFLLVSIDGQTWLGPFLLPSCPQAEALLIHSVKLLNLQQSPGYRLLQGYMLACPGMPPMPAGW